MMLRECTYDLVLVLLPLSRNFFPVDFFGVAQLLPKFGILGA